LRKVVNPFVHKEFADGCDAARPKMFMAAVDPRIRSLKA